MKGSYVKVNRIFTPIRRYGWIFTLTVAFGGLWYPKLGLLVLPMMLTMLTVSFFNGRYWCGNYCPHGSLFESLLISLSRNQKIPRFFTSRVTIGIFFIWFMVNMGGKVVKASALFGTAGFWDRLGLIFVMSYLMVTVVGGMLSVLISARTWCKICPMGVMQNLIYRLGKRIGGTRKGDARVTLLQPEKCLSCGKCSRVCPMQLTPHIEFAAQKHVEDETCIKCSTCIVHCPVKALGLIRPGTERRPIDQKD